MHGIGATKHIQVLGPIGFYGNVRVGVREPPTNIVALIKGLRLKSIYNHFFILFVDFKLKHSYILSNIGLNVELKILTLSIRWLQKQNPLPNLKSPPN